MATTPALTSKPKRTFTQTLDSLRYGELAEELTKELRQLTLKCDDLKRSGTLTLTLKLKPGKGGQVEILDDIKVTAPKPERGSTLMFATTEGHLQRNDPRQNELELDGVRSVATADAGEVRRVG